jgi:4-hydroxy-3-methylbut-2-enyl diphosphate reductase IspH
MNRQKNYLAAIAQHHVLLIVFFENTELKQNTEKLARNTEEIYIQTVIEKFAYEKKQIIEELRRIGVYSVLTAPDKLTINTINKYLELKAMGTI